MKYDKYSFQLANSYKILETIQNVKMTPREVDIVACILSGRTSKKGIASFLSIQPRTVETHTRNLMQKLGVSSWESIRDFIEKSGTSSVVRQHYQHLCLQDFFESTLEKIRIITEGKDTFFYLVFEHGRDQESILPSLEKHLSLAGITPLLKEKPQDQLLSSFLENKKTWGENFPVLFLRLGGEDSAEISNGEDEIDFTSSPYYFSVLEILKKLISLNELNPIIEKFEENFEGLQGEIITSSPISSKKPLPSDFKNTFLQRLKNPYHLFLYACLFIIFLCSIGFLSHHIATQDQGDSSLSSLLIRSDLIIPVENALLKRPELIKEMDEKLKGTMGIQTVALVGLVGMGGVGKTTLARYYAKSQSDSLIWELNAETRTDLINSFKEFAYVLAQTKKQKEELDFIQRIENSEDREKQLLFFVKNQLKNRGHWILLYDNVETISDIKDYFPQDSLVWGDGKVIITTRDGNIKNTNYIKPENIIEVGELEKEAGLMLFSKILYNQEPDKLTLDQKEKALIFLRNIPPFPLDISVSAYYIKNSHLTYDEYLEKINKFREDFEKIQKNFLKEISNYPETRYGIITASLDNIIKGKSGFKEFLFFIGLLNSQNIPKKLLEFYKTHLETDTFLHELKKHGLITHESWPEDAEALSSFSLHRSTQAIMKDFFKKILTKEERQLFIEKIIDAVKTYEETGLKGNCGNAIFLIPHMEVLIENIKTFGFPKQQAEKYELDVLVPYSYAQYHCAHNLTRAKEAFLKIVHINAQHKFLSDEFHATLLKDLGTACIYTGDFEDAISYIEDSTTLLESIPGSEIHIAKNLKTIGKAYNKKNEFTQSEKIFELALKKLSKVDPLLRQDMESKIYAQLALLYAERLLHKDVSLVAENPLKKSLEVLHIPPLYDQEKPLKPNSLSCEVARQKTISGRVYAMLGQYEEALNGFKDAHYIIDRKLDHCSHGLLKGQISCGIGEVLLREGNLKEAEQKLTESIEISKKGRNTWEARVFRAEARIRAGDLDGGYEDCISVLNLKKREQNNYSKLLYLNCLYHAAVIQWKQDNFKKCSAYFEDFFTHAKLFCELFLDEKTYQDLDAKMVFGKIVSHQETSSQDINTYLQRSLIIFSAIYGESHPFVYDYVLKNKGS